MANSATCPRLWQHIRVIRGSGITFSLIFAAKTATPVGSRPNDCCAHHFLDACHSVRDSEPAATAQAAAAIYNSESYILERYNLQTRNWTLDTYNADGFDPRTTRRLPATGISCTAPLPDPTALRRDIIQWGTSAKEIMHRICFHNAVWVVHASICLELDVGDVRFT